MGGVLQWVWHPTYGSLRVWLGRRRSSHGTFVLPQIRVSDGRTQRWMWPHLAEEAYLPLSLTEWKDFQSLLSCLHWRRQIIFNASLTAQRLKKMFDIFKQFALRFFKIKLQTDDLFFCQTRIDFAVSQTILWETVLFSRWQGRKKQQQVFKTHFWTATAQKAC